MMSRLLLSVVLVFYASIAIAQEVGVVTIIGSAQVAAVPDIAVIQVGVEVEAPTADQAMDLNGVQMQEILATLQKHEIAPRDIQTSQFSLHPQWSSRNSSTNKPPKISGFVVTNVVTVRVRDLDILGQVLDGLAKSGANRIQGIQFDVAEPAPILDQARKLAVKEALRKAALYADAAGVNLGSVLSISEGHTDVPQPALRAAAVMADSVPVARGELLLSATVTMRIVID
jgi:uncharacterized protein